MFYSFVFSLFESFFISLFSLYGIDLGYVCENYFVLIGELSTFTIIDMTHLFSLNSVILLHLMSISHLLNFSISCLFFVLFRGMQLGNFVVFVPVVTFLLISLTFALVAYFLT